MALPSIISNVMEPKDLQDIFRTLLRDKNVPSNASWEYALKLIGSDGRYELFRHHPERKQMFNAYKTQKAKEDREKSRMKIKQAKENLEKFLTTTEKISLSTKYRTAAEIFRDSEVWKAVPEIDRREIYEDTLSHRAVKEKEEVKKMRKRNTRVLGDILDSMTSITIRTTWQEAQHLLLDNPIFAEDADLLSMDKEDALKVFEEHIRQMETEEDEEKKREKKRHQRSCRKNREFFVQLLDELHHQGKLTSMSKWSELYHEISADPRFTSMLTQASYGSTPLDLFKFYVMDLKERYEDEKKTIKEIMDEKGMEVTTTTTYEDFATVISEDRRSGTLDVGNVKMFYEKLLERAQEKERDRLKEGLKVRRKLETAFIDILVKCEDKVDMDKNSIEWEDVRDLISSDEAFDAIPTETERIQLFKNYLKRREEACYHNHSKSKKNKKKNGSVSKKRAGHHHHSSDSISSRSRSRSRTPSKSKSRSRSKGRYRSRTRSRSSSDDGRRRSSRHLKRKRRRRSRSRYSSSFSRSPSRSKYRSRSRSKYRSRSRSKYRSRSRSKSWARYRSRSRSRSRTPSRERRRKGGEVENGRRSSRRRTGSVERHRRREHEKNRESSESESNHHHEEEIKFVKRKKLVEGDEKKESADDVQPPPKSATENRSTTAQDPSGKTSSTSTSRKPDDLEELEMQRRMLLQQLANQR